MRRALLLLVIVLASCTPPAGAFLAVDSSGGGSPPPDPCADYEALEAGQGSAERQHWFNHLPAAHGDKGYTRTHVACVHRWGTSEWEALDELWQLEADGGDDSNGHDWHRQNAPQAKPESKLVTQGGCDPADERCEVRWGARYIAGRYGTPSEALRAWRSRSPHWY